MGEPSFALRRYFLSQISSEASWNGMLLTSMGSSLIAVFMPAKNSGLRAGRGRLSPTDGPHDSRRKAPSKALGGPSDLGSGRVFSLEREPLHVVSGVQA